MCSGTLLSKTKVTGPATTSAKYSSALAANLASHCGVAHSSSSMNARKVPRLSATARLRTRLRPRTGSTTYIKIETIAISCRLPFARVLRIIVNHDDIERRRTLLLRQRRQQTAETFRPSVSGYAHAHLRMLGTIWSDHRSTVDTR